MSGVPVPADFAPPPTAPDLARWESADRDARPIRLERLRERMASEGVDAYFGLRRENIRYLTGFALAEGEEKAAGDSGRFLVTADEVVVLADSRYTIQAARQCPDARIAFAYRDLPSRWSELTTSIGARRIAVEAAVMPHALWARLETAAPEIELVPIEGWVETLRATKEPAELERVAAACAVADRALAALLPTIQLGRTEREVALELEWTMRTGGAEALAFDVAVLAGPEAALPHGSPGDRPIVEGAVLLFDFGAQVAGYRSDMTRTLFVGEPTPRDLEIHDLVRRAQAAAIAALERSIASGDRPSGWAIDAIARAVIEEADLGERFGHGLGHGIGLATHELPSLSRTASEDAGLPSPTVFSVEPGVYLVGETGVRIEDLVLFDPDGGRVERLTLFPREPLVVGLG
ncbi:MAG TPA: Xaa-Pro peptidase family protein [Candidatus Limnocylindrales bacterium]|nr:Xaa-Pro peptidase family protein [Candidatus Limnocylindrales bacterium]